MRASAAIESQSTSSFVLLDDMEDGGLSTLELKRDLSRPFQRAQGTSFWAMRTRKSNHRSVATTVTALAIATTAAIGGTSIASGSADAAQSIRGEVTCINSTVQGVWINAATSRSGWASWKQPIKLGGLSKATYAFTLNKGGRYQVHVGCGGTSKNWKVNAKSGWTSGTNRSFRCNDIHPVAGALGLAVTKKNLSRGIKYKTCKVV